MRQFTVTFDGGCRDGNPGHGYGSYWLQRDDDDGLMETVKHDIGGKITNNEAEYLTLIQALHRLRDKTTDKARRNGIVTIVGDSQLVLKQVSGEWSTNDERMASLRNAVIRLLDGFGSHQTRWVKRDRMVEVFGH